MAVDVTTSPTFKAGIPRAPAAVRFTVPMRGSDDSHLQRFLTVRDTKGSSSPPPSQMIVVLNWQEALQQRVPPR